MAGTAGDDKLKAFAMRIARMLQEIAETRVAGRSSRNRPARNKPRLTDRERVMTCRDRSPITHLERQLEDRLDIDDPPEDLDQRRIHLVETARQKIDELEARLAERTDWSIWGP